MQLSRKQHINPHVYSLLQKLPAKIAAVMEPPHAWKGTKTSRTQGGFRRQNKHQAKDFVANRGGVSGHCVTSQRADLQNCLCESTRFTFLISRELIARIEMRDIIKKKTVVKRVLHDTDPLSNMASSKGNSEPFKTITLQVC